MPTALALLTLLLAAPTAAQPVDAARRCRVFAEYAFALVILRDAGLPAAGAVSTLRGTFAADPGDVPEDRVATAIAEAAWSSPRPDGTALAMAVEAACLARPGSR